MSSTMSAVYRFLRSPRWAIATSIVVMVAFAFVNLGLWQLDRREERRLENEVRAARLGAEPLALSDLLASVGSDVESLEYRRTVVTGVYDPSREVLVRNMTNDGVAGFHVLTPLETADGVVVVVNRGWVPLAFDTPPVAASPPSGPTEVAGIVRLSQQRVGVGPIDPPGADVVSRVDLDYLAQRMNSDLAPVWIQAESTVGELPVPLAAPDVSDPGPHLMYAIQWFAFAVIGVVGYLAMIRKQARRSKRVAEEVV